MAAVEESEHNFTSSLPALPVQGSHWQMGQRRLSHLVDHCAFSDAFSSMLLELQIHSLPYAMHSEPKSNQFRWFNNVTTVKHQLQTSHCARNQRPIQTPRYSARQCLLESGMAAGCRNRRDVALG